MSVQKLLKCQLSDDHINQIRDLLQLKVDLLRSLFERSVMFHELNETEGKLAKTKDEKIAAGFGYYYAVSEIPNIIKEEFPEYIQYANGGYSRLLYSVAVDFRDKMCLLKGKKGKELPEAIKKIAASIPDITVIKLYTRMNGAYVKENVLHIPEYKLQIPIKDYENLKFKTYVENVFIKWPETSSRPVIYQETTSKVEIPY